jgi:hypothetical protein
MMLKSYFESSLLPLPLDRHAKDICRALQESYVLFAELACRSTVDLEDTVGYTIDLTSASEACPPTS